MNVRRYRAVDMREALRQIREMQGEDAVILSSRRIEGGIEVVAALDLEALGSASEPPAPERRSMIDGARAAPADDRRPNVSVDRAAPSVDRDTMNGVIDPNGYRETLPADAHRWADTPQNAQAGDSSRAGPRGSDLAGESSLGRWHDGLGTNANNSPGAVDQRTAHQSAVREAGHVQSGVGWSERDVTSRQGAGVAGRPSGTASRIVATDLPEATSWPASGGISGATSGAVYRQASSAAPKRASGRSRHASVHPWPVDPELAAMRNELKSLRLMLAERHADDARAAWSARHPLAAEVVSRLTEIGFDEAVARGLAASVVEGEDFASAWSGVRRRLAATLPSGGAERLDEGGVLAVVGPNGVGKTTMLGRLALRRVERHGRDTVTLVTLDHERFGAGRQLQAFATLARVPLWQVRDGADLVRRMAERLAQSPGHLFLVDSAGLAPSAMALGHPVQTLAAQLRRRMSSPPNWTNWLTVRASLDVRTLRDMMDGVMQWPAESLPRAVMITHLDELQAWGGACSAVIAARLPIAFLGDGSRLSEPLGRVDGDLVAGLLLGTPARWPEQRLEGARVQPDRTPLQPQAVAAQPAMPRPLDALRGDQTATRMDAHKAPIRADTPQLAPLPFQRDDRSWLRHRKSVGDRSAAVGAV